jgi:hypothetical protein
VEGLWIVASLQIHLEAMSCKGVTLAEKNSTHCIVTTNATVCAALSLLILRLLRPALLDLILAGIRSNSYI